MATLHQAKFMGFSTIVNTKSARPKGWSPKKKKGHLSIRSGFAVIHRPKNAKVSAITQVLTLFFFFFLETTPLGLPDFPSESRDKP